MKINEIMIEQQNQMVKKYVGELVLDDGYVDIEDKTGYGYYHYKKDGYNFTVHVDYTLEVDTSQASWVDDSFGYEYGSISSTANEGQGHWEDIDVTCSEAIMYANDQTTLRQIVQLFNLGNEALNDEDIPNAALLDMLGGEEGLKKMVTDALSDDIVEEIVNHYAPERYSS